MLHFIELRIVFVKKKKSYNLALFREHFHQYFEILLHAKLLYLKAFKDFKSTFKDFKSTFNDFLKALKKNFQGFHIFQDFKDP